MIIKLSIKKKYEYKNDKYALITTTAWIISNVAASGGVVLVVSWKSEKSLTEINQVMTESLIKTEWLWQISTAIQRKP